MNKWKILTSAFAALVAYDVTASIANKRLLNKARWERDQVILRNTALTEVINVLVEAVIENETPFDDFQQIVLNEAYNQLKSATLRP